MYLNNVIIPSHVNITETSSYTYNFRCKGSCTGLYADILHNKDSNAIENYKYGMCSLTLNLYPPNTHVISAQNAG